MNYQVCNKGVSFLDDSDTEAMNLKDISSFSVSIHKDKDGTRISISNIQVDPEREEFGAAYKLIHELWRLAESLDTEIEQHLEVLEMKKRIDELWSKDEAGLSEIVTDNSHRIALFLLKKHPKAIIEAEIVRNTGVNQRTTNKQLRGNVKSTKDYFEQTNGGYQLTAAALDWLKNTVLPKYTGPE